MFWVLKRPAFLRFHTGTSNIEHVCEWEFFFFFSHIFVYVGFVSAFYCRLFTCFRGFYISFCLYYLFFVMFFCLLLFYFLSFTVLFCNKKKDKWNAIKWQQYFSHREIKRLHYHDFNIFSFFNMVFNMYGALVTQ